MTPGAVRGSLQPHSRFPGPGRQWVGNTLHSTLPGQPTRRGYLAGSWDVVPRSPGVEGACARSSSTAQKSSVSQAPIPGNTAQKRVRAAPAGGRLAIFRRAPAPYWPPRRACDNEVLFRKHFGNHGFCLRLSLPYLPHTRHVMCITLWLLRHDEKSLEAPQSSGPLERNDL